MLRLHVADKDGQAMFFLRGDILFNQPVGFFQAEGLPWTEALALEGAVRALQSASGLLESLRGLDMRHAGDSNDFLEAAGNELLTFGGVDPGSEGRKLHVGLFEQDRELARSRRFAQPSIEQKEAGPIEHGAMVTKSAEMLV